MSFSSTDYPDLLEELVDTDDKRKKRFIRGLRAILHREVTSQHHITFDDAIEQDYWNEEEDEKVVAEIKEKRRKNNFLRLIRNNQG